MKKQKRCLITKHKMSILYSLIVKKRKQKTEIQRIEILDHFFKPYNNYSYFTCVNNCIDN